MIMNDNNIVWEHIEPLTNNYNTQKFKIEALQNKYDRLECKHRLLRKDYRLLRAEFDQVKEFVLKHLRGNDSGRD